MSHLIETLTHILSTLTEKQTEEDRKATSRQTKIEQSFINKAARKAHDYTVGQSPTARHYASAEDFDAAYDDYKTRSRYFWDNDPLFSHGRENSRSSRKELYRRLTNPTPEEQEEDKILLAKQKAISRERSKKLASLENDYKERLRQKARDKRQAELDHYASLSPREKRRIDYAKEFEADPVKAASTPIRRAKPSEPTNSSYWGGTMATINRQSYKGHGPDRDDS